MELTSPAFTDGQHIPVKYTCDGADVSPPLRWTKGPSGTECFALICDDPDAPRGTWSHWVIYNIPAGTSELPEHVAVTEILGSGAKQGGNDFKRIGYGGPCPPPGKPHRYFFKLYALDAQLRLPPTPMKANLLRAIEGHLLAETSLMGVYQRRAA